MMSKELIERINNEIDNELRASKLFNFDRFGKLLLRDCKAEIERLEREQNISFLLLTNYASKIKELETELAEAKEQNAYCVEDWDKVTVALGLTVHSDPEDLLKRIAELQKAREYVPMTDDEIHDVWLSSDLLNATETMRLFEQAIIQRANLTVKDK